MTHGSISGSLFNDVNHGAPRGASELGLVGWTVYADLNNDGTLDPGEPSTMTDPLGNYALTGLAPGQYVVREILPPGWRRTSPASASADIAVGTGPSATGPAFGNVRVATVPLDFSYLLTLAQHYGDSGTFATGDVTGDDLVNFDGLLLVAQTFGHALLERPVAKARR